MNFFGTTTATWMLALAISLGFTSCRLVSSLGGGGGEEKPYSKETQLAYFEGQAHLLKGDLEDAYASFLKCADEEPDEVAFHYQLGKIDLELKRYEAAERHLNEAVDLDPTNSWVRYHRGEARLAQGNGPGAEDDWTLFVVARPGDLESLFRCAEQLLQEGHVWPTLNLFSNYESQVGNDEDVRTEALRIVEQTADAKNLKQFLQQARQDFPESDLFHLQWARFLMASGDFESCHDELTTLAKKRPDWGLVQFELAEWWVRQGDVPASLPFLKRAISTDDVPLENLIRVVLGYGVLAQGNPEYHNPYSELLGRMMERHGDDPTVLEMACDWAYQNDRLEEALELASALLDVAPESLESWNNLMAIRVDLSQWEAMVGDAEQALARFPLDPLLHYYHGFALRQSKQSAKAVNAFEGGLNVVLDNPVLEGALASSLASALRDLGEYDRSEAAFERSLKAIEDPYVLNNHAYYLAGRHPYEKGKEHLDRALDCSSKANELMPEEGNFMDTQAYVLFKLRRYQEALPWILKAQEHGMANDPVALEHEGDIRWSLGELDAARDAWKRALDAGGDPDVLTPKINRP